MVPRRDEAHGENIFTQCHGGEANVRHGALSSQGMLWGQVNFSDFSSAATRYLCQLWTDPIATWGINILR